MTKIYRFTADGLKLGKLCPKGHSYNGSQFSLRYAGGSCVECQKVNARRRSAAGANAEWNRRNRLKNGRLSRSKNAANEVLPVGVGKAAKLASGLALALKRNGIQPTAAMIGDMCKLHLWLRDYRLPSVTQLVMAEQLRYWEESPEAHAQHRRQWRVELWRFRYLTNPSFRAYNREKSRRRKAQMRGGHVIKVTAAQLRQRFAEFGNACAYCGTGGNLHIEHVVPISRGGTHTLGNVLPACQRCNYSKRAQDVSAWYLSQPFFSQPRWRRIGRVLGWGSGSPAQLTLL